jgi:hypothetical protein
MAILRADIIRALDELIANEAGTRFQALAVALAKQKWPELIASEWHNDGGLDAYAPSSLADGKKSRGVASSLAANIGKVKGDAETAKKNYSDLEILIFMTPRKVTVSTAKGWADELRRACRLELHVVSREDIITSLMLPTNASLCGTLPGITVPIESCDADLLVNVRAAVAEEAELWRMQRMADRPIIPLHAVKLDGDGRELSDTMDTEALRTALTESRRIALEAPGGGGKTTTLVHLAMESPGAGEVSFLVDLPAWIHSGADVLEFVARGRSFRSRDITSADLARLARRAHFSFLLNGWNEIAEVHSVSAITSLAQLERDFPTAGIMVATRTHHVSPPLPGAIRAKLLRITRQQRADYLRQTLGDRAEELRLHLVGNRVLDELTRTPLILAEVVTIFQSGNPVPSTRSGVLGAVMKLIETATAHQPHLQLAPLSNCAERYLTHLAAEMTGRREVLIFAVDARVAMRSASATLLAKNQVSITPDPDAVLHALTAHHVLEQIDHPSVAYRFQHQQFQEFYAARFLADVLRALVPKQDSAADKAFAASYINEPMWEEPLRMVAEEIALAIKEGSATGTALDEGARLVRLALPVDPILAADLARLMGSAVWTEVRDEISTVLRHWHSIGDTHHKQLAQAAMMATGSGDFADVFVPLLTDADQVRFDTYHACDTFYPTILGADWRRLVDAWHEDARADFVFEVTHRGRMADVGESFASRDPSEKVRQQAIRALCWISASDVLERIVNGLDDASLDAIFPAFHPEIVPTSVQPRFVAANRRLIGRETTPLGRIRFSLRGTEYGDDAIAPELMKELAALSPPFDEDAGPAIEAALKIVKTHDPTWVNDWLTAKLLDGSLRRVHGKRFLQPVSQKKGNDLVRALATRELSYQEASATHLILSTGATPELAQQIFDQLCNLQRSISRGGAQPLVGTCFSQLREAFRSLSIDIAVTGMMRSLQGDFDIEKFKVVADVLGRVNADADELRSMLPAALRDPLRRYLKDGISEVLAHDLLDNETRSEAAISLGRIGDPEDLVDLERMIEADIGRADGKLARISYANWYRFAVAWLDAPNADATFIALLRDENYLLEAARGLFELAMPLRRDTPTDYEAIWKARGGKRPQGFDAERAKRYAEAIKGRIAELKQEAAAAAAPQYATGRAKELAVLLAALDGRDFADVVIETLSLPARWDAYPRMNGIRALLLSGATLDLAQMLAVLDPAIEHAVSQRLHDENLSLLFHCLELLPFSDDPVGALARIEEVMAKAKFKYHPYQVGELITALGHTRSEAAVPFLISVARGKGVDLHIADAWIRSMGRLNTESARRALLSIVDPDIPSVGVSINFDHHSEIYAAFVGEWARQDSTLRNRLLALSQSSLSASQQAPLRAIYYELSDEDAMIAGADLLQGSLLSLGGDRAPKEQFLERRPSGRSSWSFETVPRNAERARAQLFQTVLDDDERRKAAFAILGQVEVWRLKYGRPPSEPRHPMFDTGEPWPPLSLFLKG